MKQTYSNNIWKILVCPQCGNALKQTDDGASCASCQIAYNYSDTGALDLRLRKKKKYQLQFELDSGALPDSMLEFEPLTENTSPQIDFSTIKIPERLSKELISYFPKAKAADSLMLDLGCGSTLHREICKHAGFEYVGLDYYACEAPILGDAHSLPFSDNSFEFILFINTLEHCRYPFIAIREIVRILKSGGTLIGTVAFLEPFHDNSFYHHTHLGILNSLLYSGLRIKYIAPNPKWPVFVALAHMHFFRGMPGLLSKALVLPLHILHRLWWTFISIVSGKKLNNYRLRKFAGSFAFIANKE